MKYFNAYASILPTYSICTWNCISLNVIFYIIFSVVVSNTTCCFTLFFTNQLRLDVGRRFLLTHTSCVCLHIRRHSSPMVVDIGLVDAIGGHFLVLDTPDGQRTYIRVSNNKIYDKFIDFFFI